MVKSNNIIGIIQKNIHFYTFFFKYQIGLTNPEDKSELSGI